MGVEHDVRFFEAVVFNLFCKIAPLQALCLKIAPFL